MTKYIEKPRYSCALGGALATVNAIPRGVTILHASLGCGGMTSASINAASGYLGSGYCGGNSIPASGLTEKEIVFGGAERLAEQIKNTVEIIDADLFVVVTGCTSEIIGDDVASVVRDYNENRGDHPPIIHASGAGFKGDSLWGYDSVLSALFKDYVETAIEQRPGVVNLWGLPPAQDVFWEGNLLELRRLLELLGLEVNTLFTNLDNLDVIRKSAEAELNIVASHAYGVEAAQVFKDTHGTPFITTNFPIGAKATAIWLHEIGAELGLEYGQIESVIQVEQLAYYRFFNRISDIYSDIDLQRYVVVIGDQNYSQALTRFVTGELGWIPGLVVVTDQVTHDQHGDIRHHFEGALESPGEEVVFETDTSLIPAHLWDRWPRSSGSRYYRPFSPAFVFGSRLDKDFADGIGAVHLSVSYPVSNRSVMSRGYAGFRGGLSLAEDIFTSILSPR